jgi:ribosomal protein L5
MNFLKYFYKNTLKFDLVNKFNYTNLKKLPKIKKITLNFNCKTVELKNLSRHLIALELITNQKSNLAISNYSLKIKKGKLSGCKITLKNKHMLLFLSKNLNEIFFDLKNFNEIVINQKTSQPTVSFSIKNSVNFLEISKNYNLFNNLSLLNVFFTLKITTNKELLFLLKSLKIPFRFTKTNNYQ